MNCTCCGHAFPYALAYVALNFTRMSRATRFLNITADVLTSLLDSSNLVAPPHVQMSAIFRWVRHDKKKRLGYLDGMLDGVKKGDGKKYRRRLVVLANLRTLHAGRRVDRN